MEARAKWLADLCGQRGLTRVVEVGVHRGRFSRWLLESNPVIYLVGVDPYAPYPENTTDRTRDLAEARCNYGLFPGRCELLLLRSEDAAKVVDSPHCVYVDGAHDSESVTVDCEVWWARLSPGDLLSGHDYNHRPVAAAVDAFAFRHRLQVGTYTDVEEGGWVRTNWYVNR